MIKKFIELTGLFSCFLLFLTIVLSYFTMPRMSVLSLLSLLVPWLVFVNLFFSVYWLFLKRPVALLPLAVSILSYMAFGQFFSFSFSGPDNIKGDSSISIMSFNVRGFNTVGLIGDKNVDQQILNFVQEQDPDIICFQEFNRSYHEKLKQYTFRAHTPYVYDRTIQYIFSKYPIVNQGSLDFPETANNAIFADIRIKNDTIRVYNAHMQSYNIYPSRRYLLKAFPFKLWQKFDKTLRQQQEQALIFDRHRKSSAYPSIVCADLNNSQFSYVYRTLKNEMQDSFQEAGSGFGYTLKFLRFPMRIDFIFSDPSFEIRAHQNFYPKLSDHFPVMAGIELKSQE